MLNFLSGLLGNGRQPSHDLDTAELAQGQLVHNRSQIIRMLRQFAADRQPLRMLCKGSAKPETCHILAVEADRLLLSQLWNDAAHESVLKSGELNLSGLHEGAPVLFSMRILGTADSHGAPCYRTKLPEWMLRLQLRDSLRVPLPSTVQATLHCPLNTLDARVFDISEEGLGLLVKEDASLQEGMRLKQVQLQLEGEQLSALNLEVRHVSPHGRRQLVGMHIDALSEPQRQVLRRFILTHQRVSGQLEQP